MQLDATRAPAPPSTPGRERAARPGRWIRVRACARMGRTVRWENFLGTPLWWSLLPAALAWEPRTGVLVALTLLAYAAMVAVCGTLDDLQGYRDGSDLANYHRSDPSGLRPLTRKPLLLGWVTERQAARYAAAASVVCVAALVAAWLVGTAEPAWWLPGWAGVLFAGTQYSAGLRLSYHGAQELTLFTIKAGSVAFPYLLVAGDLPGGVAVPAAVLGLWFVQVSMCSNTHDAAGDRAAGRRTLATRLGEAGHRRAIAAVVATGWALLVGAVVADLLSPWQLLAVSPLAALHARQLRFLGRGSALRARATGFLALRLGVAGLCLSSLAIR